MGTKTAIMTVEVDLDEEATDTDSVSNALDILLETAMSTPGILEEYGDADVGAFIPRQRIWADVYVRGVLCQGCASYDEAGGVQAPRTCRECWTLRPSNYMPR